MFRSRSVRRSTTTLAAVAAAALALAACSGGAGNSSSAALSSSSAGSSGQRAAGDAAGSGAKVAAPQQGSQGSPSSVDPAALEASRDRLARKASIAVQVKDIRQSVAKVRAMTAAVNGVILSESIGASTGGIPLASGAQVSANTYGEMTISVPADQLDSVIDELAGLGTVISAQSSSENVGDQIIDTQSRLETMRASVDRVRALMTRATDLTQIVTLESELSRRQADLEALESQLAALKDSVAMSPVQISLTTQPGVIAPRPAHTGFLQGLKSGWAGFTASLAAVLTILGAVLPFAILAALVGFPVWWALRRRRAGRPTPEPQPVSAG